MDCFEIKGWWFVCDWYSFMFSYLVDRISSMNGIMYWIQYWRRHTTPKGMPKSFEIHDVKMFGCKIIVNVLYIALIWTRTPIFYVSGPLLNQHFNIIRHPKHNHHGLKPQLPPVYQRWRPLASWTLATRRLHRHRGNLHGRAKSRKVPLQKPRPMEHPQESAKLQLYLC